MSGPLTQPQLSNRRPRHRRDQIAQNAGELFSARGFHSVRMDDIAEASGITARALYRHFANKQALLSHVVIEDQQRFVEILTSLLAQASEDRQPDHALTVLTNAALESPRLSLLWQREARHLDTDEYRLVRDRTRRIADQFGNLLIRPDHSDLDTLAAEIRSWAVVSIVSGPGFYEFTLSRQRLSQELIAASRRVIAQPAPVPGAGSSGPAGDGRTPSSRREQLINTAAHAFRHNGFGGVSLDDIGREVGIVGPALYRYFDSKADILVAAVTRFYEWQALELTRAMRSPCPDEGVLASFIQGYIRIAVEATDLLAVSLTEPLYLPPTVAERFDRLRADYIGEWQRWFSVARPELPETHAGLLVNVAKTIIDDCVRIPHLQRNPDFPHHIHCVVLAALGLEGSTEC